MNVCSTNTESNRRTIDSLRPERRHNNERPCRHDLSANSGLVQGRSSSRCVQRALRATTARPPSSALLLATVGKGKNVQYRVYQKSLESNHFLNGCISANPVNIAMLFCFNESVANGLSKTGLNVKSVKSFPSYGTNAKLSNF